MCVNCEAVLSHVPPVKVNANQLVTEHRASDRPATAYSSTSYRDGSAYRAPGPGPRDRRTAGGRKRGHVTWPFSEDMAR